MHVSYAVGPARRHAGSPLGVIERCQAPEMAVPASVCRRARSQAILGHGIRPPNVARCPSSQPRRRAWPLLPTDADAIPRWGHANAPTNRPDLARMPLAVRPRANQPVAARPAPLMCSSDGDEGQNGRPPQRCIRPDPQREPTERDSRTLRGMLMMPWRRSGDVAIKKTVAAANTPIMMY